MSCTPKRKPADNRLWHPCDARRVCRKIVQSREGVSSISLLALCAEGLGIKQICVSRRDLLKLIAQRTWSEGRGDEVSFEDYAMLGFVGFAPPTKPLPETVLKQRIGTATTVSPKPAVLVALGVLLAALLEAYRYYRDTAAESRLDEMFCVSVYLLIDYSTSKCIKPLEQLENINDELRRLIQ